MSLFCTFGHLTSFGTYLSWYGQNQLSSHSPSTISWIGSLQLLVFFFSVSAPVFGDTTKDSNSTRGQWWGGASIAMARGHYL